VQALTIPAYAVINGAMPTIGTCALHGRPMVATRTMTFKGKPPAWVWALLLVGVLIAVLVAESTRPKVTGPVPECDQCIAERQARKRRILSLWVATGVLFVAALVVAQHATLCAILAILATAGLVWALVEMMRADRKGLQGSVSKDGQWVTVSVEESHYQAVRRAMAAASSPA
jgi:hypothetical protein